MLSLDVFHDIMKGQLSQHRYESHHLGKSGGPAVSDYNWSDSLNVNHGCSPHWHPGVSQLHLALPFLSLMCCTF